MPSPGKGKGYRRLESNDLEGSHKMPLRHDNLPNANCAEASKSVDVAMMGIQKCTVFPEVDPIHIVYQDGDSVTFTVSQSWKGCQNDEDQNTVTWMATDFIGDDGNLECSTVSNVACGQTGMHTALCEDGVSIVDIYAFDAEGTIFRSPQEKVYLPLACNVSGEASKLCHFRYVLKCSPSLCDVGDVNRNDDTDGGDMKFNNEQKEKDDATKTMRRALRAQ